MNIEIYKKKKNELNLTYEKLAIKSQVSKRTLVSIFKGNMTNPRLETIQAIEKALNIEEQELTTTTKEEKELLKLYRQLPQHLKRGIIEFIRSTTEQGNGATKWN